MASRNGATLSSDMEGEDAGPLSLLLELTDEPCVRAGDEASVPDGVASCVVAILLPLLGDMLDREAMVVRRSTTKASIPCTETNVPSAHGVCHTANKRAELSLNHGHHGPRTCQKPGRTIPGVSICAVPLLFPNHSTMAAHIGAALSSVKNTTQPRLYYCAK